MLDYTHIDSNSHFWKLAKRITATFVLLFAILCFIYKLPRLELIYLQWQCGQWEKNNGKKILYSSNDVDSTGNKHSIDYSYWERLQKKLGLVNSSKGSALIYLGNRYGSDGRERLVAVERNMERSGNDDTRLRVYVIRPATLFDSPRVTMGYLGDRKQVDSMNKGMSDPNDKSHFSVACTANGVKDELEGWISKKGLIEMQYRNESLVYDPLAERLGDHIDRPRAIPDGSIHINEIFKPSTKPVVEESIPLEDD